MRKLRVHKNYYAPYLLARVTLLVARAAVKIAGAASKWVKFGGFCGMNH